MHNAAGTFKGIVGTFSESIESIAETDRRRLKA
jgi:hypothetical protein